MTSTRSPTAARSTTAGFVDACCSILAMILLGAFYIIYYPVLVGRASRLVRGTGVAVVVVFFQVIFQLFDIYIPSANIGGSLLITYLTFTGYRLAFQENLQWRQLKQAQYLKEVDQMKSNFLSLVSHDLKTPLAKIQAATERLRREQAQSGIPGPPHLKEVLDSIDNSNNELKHYITSVINLSRIESQKVILNKKSNDINQLIQQAIKRLRQLASQKSLTFEERLEPLFSVECDEDLMRQVLTNLIDNAVKYSPPARRQNHHQLARGGGLHPGRGPGLRAGHPQRPAAAHVPQVQPVLPSPSKVRSKEPGSGSTFPSTSIDASRRVDPRALG